MAGTASHCLRHQERPAVNRCKACLKPLCEECTYTTPQGKFCSDDCHKNDASSMERMARMKADEAELEAQRRKAALVKMVVFIVLAVGLYFGWPHLPSSIRTPVEKLYKSVTGPSTPPPKKH